MKITYGTALGTASELPTQDTRQFRNRNDCYLKKCSVPLVINGQLIYVASSIDMRLLISARSDESGLPVYPYRNCPMRYGVG